VRLPEKKTPLFHEEEGTWNLRGLEEERGIEGKEDRITKFTPVNQKEEGESWGGRKRGTSRP